MGYVWTELLERHSEHAGGSSMCAVGRSALHGNYSVDYWGESLHGVVAFSMCFIQKGLSSRCMVE